MESTDARMVTLSGYRSGTYDVVEERPDGSLVIAPQTVAGEPRAVSSPERPAPCVGDLFSGLMTRPSREAKTVPELLRARGVTLAADEGVREFVVVEINGRRGRARGAPAHKRARRGADPSWPTPPAAGDNEWRGTADWRTGRDTLARLQRSLSPAD